MSATETGAVMSVTDIATPMASRYLQQLCKHFAHKLDVTFDETAGSIAFSAGICRLQAEDETLRISLEPVDKADLDRLQDVVVRHLIRFAFREELEIAWHPA